MEWKGARVVWLMDNRECVGECWKEGDGCIVY